jgi:hypothetical protein
VLGDILGAHFTLKDTSRALLNTQNLDLLMYADLQLADIAIAIQLYALIACSLQATQCGARCSTSSRPVREAM